MNNYFKIIVDYGLGVEKVFNRFVKLLNKNIKQQRNICWKQLQQEVMKKKNNQKILKSAVNFSIRYKKVVLNKAFHKIIFFVGFKEKKLSKKFFTSRQWIMNNIFTRLLETKIKEPFIKLLKSAREKDLYKGKVQIFMSKVKKIKQKVIMKTWNCLKKNDKEEFEQLKGKLRSIEDQLLVKEKKCKELQNVLEKDDIYENRRRAISQTNIKEERNKRSNSEEKKSENGNGNSHKQYSIIGSVLNGSFLTFKSGISSGQNSMNGIDCNCGYKHKYSYYKCESVSLKNQLEIIKKQL